MDFKTLILRSLLDTQVQVQRVAEAGQGMPARPQLGIKVMLCPHRKGLDETPQENTPLGQDPGDPTGSEVRRGTDSVWVAPAVEVLHSSNSWGFP